MHCWATAATVFKFTWEELNDIKKESRIQIKHLRAIKPARDLIEQDAMQAFLEYTNTSTLK
jgi:hypothetical protein